VLLSRSVAVVADVGGVPVGLRTAQVTVKFQISQRTDTKTVKVAAQILTPPTWSEEQGIWQKYDLKRQDPAEWLLQLAFRGPKKDVEQLRAEDVQAYVVLKEDDKKPVSWLVRDVVIRLPRELRLELVGATPQVHFKLVERPAGPPTP